MASAPSMTTYLANKILANYLGGVPFTPPAVLYLGLATSCTSGGVITGEPTIGQYGYARVPFAITDVSCTFANGGTACTVSGGTTTYPIGTILAFSNSGGALPANISANTPYFVVGGSGSTITVSTSPGGTAITFASAGTGTQYVTSVWGTAATAQIQNAVALTFPEDVSTNWGTMSIFVIVDASTAGNVWFYNTITGATTVNVGQTPYFPASQLTIGPMA